MIYGAGSMVAGNLHVIRVIFSTSLAPVIARYHEAQDRAAIERTLGDVARWATSLIAPIILAFVALRQDLLRLVHNSFALESGFILLLLCSSLLNCFFGDRWALHRLHRT